MRPDWRLIERRRNYVCASLRIIPPRRTVISRSTVAFWLQLVLAIVAGACAGLALAPWHWVPLYLVGFSLQFVLVWRQSGPVTAAAAGWCFGFGYFFVGVHWVGHAFLVDVEKFGWMMPFAVAFLSALLALFPAAACAAAHAVGRTPGAFAVAFVGVWPLSEWLRGTVLSGFPWHHYGYVWGAADESMQAAALLGPHMLALIAIAAAVGPGLVLVSGRGQRLWPLLWVAGSLLLVAGLTLYGWVRLATPVVEQDTQVRLRIVQPAIAQAEKWLPELRDSHLQVLLSLSSEPHVRKPTHVIWPETATPFFLPQHPARAARIARSLPPGSVLLTGTPRGTGQGKNLRVYNSLVAVDRLARTTVLYDKRHLVPFGEYLPLRGLLSWVGLDKLAVSPVDFSSGELPPVAAVANAPPVRPLICYEVIFPSEVASGPRPGWLLNVTNDAWFGDSAGPRQHLAIARMRAVEQGLPLVRAANTGISALIDPYGRLRATLDIGARGVIDHDLPVALTPPLYAVTGNVPFFVVLTLLAIAAIWLACRRQSATVSGSRA